MYRDPCGGSARRIISVQSDMNHASAPAVIDESPAFDGSNLIRVANV